MLPAVSLYFAEPFLSGILSSLSHVKTNNPARATRHECYPLLSFHIKTNNNAARPPTLMKMSLEEWKASMRTSIDGIEGALSAADPTPQKTKLADLRKRLEGPSVGRHRKRLEDELDALVEGDVAIQIAARRYLRPKVQEAMEEALVTLERAKQALAKAAEMRKRIGKKSRRPVTPAH